ncbi:type IV secretory system conjugative DNA transfer family protein [Deinococcus xinjiangensis]
MNHIGEELIKLGWDKVFHATSPMMVYLRCTLETQCAAAQNKVLTQLFPYKSFIMACIPLLGAALLFRFRTVTREVKMPGQQRWANETDQKIKLYIMGDTKRPENKQSGYLGYFMNPLGNNRFDLKKLQMLMPPVEDRCTNTVIIAGVGAGKTSGLFIPMLMMDAIQGNTVILFDLKWPNRKGFYNIIGFWAKLGRKVQVFAPFEERDTLRLPLLAGVQDMKTALEVADSIITPPEYQKEVGEHYKNIERTTLASIILAVANHPVPSKRTFREVLRIAQSTKNELDVWYQRESIHNPDIKEAMKGVFDRSPAANADMLRGLVSELKIFFNPLLERATTASEGQNLDLSFTEPTLHVVAIGQEHIMDGSGEPLIKVIKRIYDRALLEASNRDGGSLKIHAEYYQDEFNNSARFGNMMRSTATLRERNIGMTLGVQNSKQGQLVYGELYYEAMTENTIGHTILLPYGITGREAMNWSEILGKTTKVVQSFTHSNEAWFPNPFGGRQSAGERVEVQPFLPAEEFPTFTKNEGLIMTMGCPPTRIKLPRFDARYIVERPWYQFWVNPVENRIAKVYRNVMGNTKPGELTDQYLADPKFRLGGGANREAKEAPITPEALFHAWVDEIIDQGAKIRLVKATEPPKIYIHTDSFKTSLTSLQLDYLIEQGKWIARAQNSSELRISESGIALLGEAKTKQVINLEFLSPLVRWMRAKAGSIEHHPIREALPEDQRDIALGYYEYESLALPLGTAKDLLGVVPQLPTKRIGTRDMVIIPLNDPARLESSIMAAREHQISPSPTGWGKERVKRQAELAAQALEEAVNEESDPKPKAAKTPRKKPSSKSLLEQHREETEAKQEAQAKEDEYFSDLEKNLEKLKAADTEKPAEKPSSKPTRRAKATGKSNGKTAASAAPPPSFAPLFNALEVLEETSSTVASSQLGTETPESTEEALLAAFKPRQAQIKE